MGRWVTSRGRHIYIPDEGEENPFAKDTKSKEIPIDEVTSDRIIEEIAGKDIYTLSPEYKKLSKECSELFNEYRTHQDKYWKLKDELEKESKPKPKSEWTDDDEFNALIGHRPVIYTEKGKKLKSDYDKHYELARKAEKEWEAKTEQLKKVDNANREKSLAELDKADNRDLIVPKQKDSYNYFKTDESTTPYIDDMLKEGRAEVFQMPPKVYIAECAKHIFENATLETTIRGRNARDVKKYMKMMKDGVKFDTPYLNYRDSQQEGLHRAIAAHMLGLEEMPVIVVRK